ncbi:3-phosphoshikimate 1-carboxyvinyltransferase [Halorhodospira neutriphila]|uniref:3-phosphoshikimate 1-carboxyvinyltransferase n=1 Tax=Halorhodospira neutriphila TaxID=168379 RepID=A0ABS1E4Y7_9GAMM|nr:3-phosphoshikimate 1-carboxyvinyltransferase [Halorhodospira neutriphila]
MSAAAGPQRAWRVAPGGSLRGELRVPGDKSISHRAVMLGALARGETRITGLLEGADVLATVGAFRQLGVAIEGPRQGAATIQGAGREGLRAPSAPLDVGNSGTSMRLLAGLLAGLPFEAVLTGDASLNRRPMGRVTEPLAAMGARIGTAEGGTAPLRLHAGGELHGIDYTLPVASAQVKSALLLAGLHAAGRTCVREPAPTRDHTERMLTGFGYPVAVQGRTACLDGGGALTATAVDVPGDLSSAAFLLVGASIAPGSELVLRHVGWNPTRTGAVTILRQMGADIEVLREGETSGEPVADLRVRSAPLHGIRIPEALVPLAIDEFPALLIAAACAEGETLLTGAEELRVKESDRIAVMAEGLRRLGVAAEPRADGLRLVGQPRLAGGVRLDSHGDHRIAMAFAVAALRAQAPVQVDDCENVGTSFPGFVSLMGQAGLEIQALPAAGA